MLENKQNSDHTVDVVFVCILGHRLLDLGCIKWYLSENKIKFKNISHGISVKTHQKQSTQLINDMNMYEHETWSLWMVNETTDSNVEWKAF